MTAAAIMETAPAPASSRSRLRSYALWQMRDYLINKGIATALVSGLILFIAWTALPSGDQRFGGMGAVIGAAAVDMLLVQFISQIVLFGVLFATNGVVSEDRKFGYYRFYFSKPVSAGAFYGQKFAVHMIGLIAVTALMLGAFSLAIDPRFQWGFFPVLAMAMVGLGGIGFLLSAMFTLDWISLLGVYFASRVGWALWADDTGIRGMLIRALPPVHELEGVFGAMVAGEVIPMKPLWWIFLYGVGCLVLGFVVLSRRPLATN